MVDELDNRILNIIMENSKLSYRKIAARTGVSVATIMHRVNALEKSGVIRKYSASLDHEKLGYDVSVIVEMKISRGKLIEVEKKIATHPSVSSVFDVTGQADSIIIASFKTRKELDTFLKKIQTYEFVERVETKLILNTVKDDHIKVG